MFAEGSGNVASLHHFSAFPLCAAFVLHLYQTEDLVGFGPNATHRGKEVLREELNIIGFGLFMEDDAKCVDNKKN